MMSFKDFFDLKITFAENMGKDFWVELSLFFGSIPIPSIFLFNNYYSVTSTLSLGNNSQIHSISIFFVGIITTILLWVTATISELFF